MAMTGLWKAARKFPTRHTKRMIVQPMIMSLSNSRTYWTPRHTIVAVRVSAMMMIFIPESAFLRMRIRTKFIQKYFTHLRLSSNATETKTRFYEIRKVLYSSFADHNVHSACRQSILILVRSCRFD